MPESRMVPMTIIQAERAWHKAHAEHERIDTIHTYKAEQSAWDVYANLCDEAGQCLQPGCRRHSPEAAWCLEHGAS
jgi:hypothetical protein